MQLFKSQPASARVAAGSRRASVRQPRHAGASVIAQATRLPPDAPKDEKPGGREWLGTILSRFGPVKDKSVNTTVLEFEKPLLELDKRIKEVRRGAELLSIAPDHLGAEPGLASRRSARLPRRTVSM